MKELQINIKIKKPFGNLFRKETVLIAGTTNNREIIVTRKSVYPPGIFRLLGGGVETGETMLQAAQRETKEELGKQYDSKDFKPIINVTVDALDEEKNRYHHLIRVYSLYVNSDKLQAGDDAELITKISTAAMIELSHKYQQLPPSLVSDQIEPPFSWNDYGKVYGPIHEETAKLLKKDLK